MIWIFFMVILFVSCSLLITTLGIKILKLLIGSIV